jgi:uncharacterized phiE125 gp8 family phage protein
MPVFIQPPFWSTRSYGRRTPHATSVLVTPAVAIVSSSVANPTVLTTSVPHGLASGDTVTIAGHTGSTPALDGSHLATVLTPTTFSVPVTVTVGGTGGTVTRALAIEPLTRAQGKLRAGLDWADGDARDALMDGFISTARSKVEHDTGLALLTQTRDVYYDALPDDPFTLPAQSTPLQAVLSVKTTDTAGVINTVATDQYLVDLANARIGLADVGVWPSDLRGFQPWVIRIVAGWTAPALIPPQLVHAVGLLVAHYMTAGRDLVSAEGYEEVPQGYAEAIGPYQLVTVP